MDMTLYALLNKRIKSAVSGIDSYVIEGTNLIFKFKDGTSATMHFPVPKDGVSITDVQLDDNGHLICILSDSTTLDAGKIPTIKGDKGFSPLISPNKNNNEYVYKLDITDETGTYTTPNLKGTGGPADMSNYYTKQEADKAIQDSIDASSISEEELDDILNSLL